MRIAALLLLVFGSTQCYLINLYNERPTPLTITTTRNGVLSAVILPAAANGVPSLTEMGEYGNFESSRFEYLNVHTATNPILMPSGDTWIDVEAGYADQPVNTDVAMRLDMSESMVLCNFMQNPLCYQPDGNFYDYTQVFTMQYLVGFQVRITFTNRNH
ncbi:hypothetical protein PRIPAC_89263 [Pristionchus pacificus]|uniref:Uncharacterized protein n=1 Tax=Pristionchus pacificus TaxID=54126 RepID=A0A2A6B9G2_PRIPA|nr:hypothetical protein PRIPAC_89263 [Pristionchus pacificus]|eukprot:PDM62507.1 hypothetical protein PRIPAC_51949 [Pristionchus pacificus]